MRKRMVAFLLAVFLAASVVPVRALGASVVTVTFQVIGGAWSSGEMFRVCSFEPGHVLTEADVPNDMSPGDGFGGGSWQVEPVGMEVSQDMSFRFVYVKMANVTFDANGGHWDGDTRFETLAPVGSVCEGWPEDPERSGYVFSGWSDQFDEDTPVEEDLVLYAQWRENRWITFDANGGSWAGEPSLELEAPGGLLTDLPDAPERAGWEFDHWNTAPDGSGQLLEEGRELQTNTTAYAQWRRIFILYFDGNSEIAGKAAEYTPEKVGVLSHFFETPDLSRPGYTLLGWNTRADGTGQEVPVGGAFRVDAENNPATLYARWERRTCHVTFEETVLSCFWGDTLPEADFPEPAPVEGHRFAGWRTAPEGKGALFTGDSPITEDLTLYPHWIAQAEVTFLIENGTWAENGGTACTVTLDQGASLADKLPTPIPDEAFKETGTWSPRPGTAAAGAVFTYTCDACQHFKVSFDTDDEPLDVLEGHSPKLPEPTREGCRFAGWYTAKNGGKKFEEGTVVTGNLVLYAHWNPVFTLTYDVGDGENGPEPVCLEESGDDCAFTVSDEIPVREGWSFQGWTEDPESETHLLHGGDPCQAGRDVILYAVWKKDLRPVTLTFLDRGTEAAHLTVLSGEQPGDALPAAPARRGWRFLGWNEAADGSGEFLTNDTKIDRDMTLYACWEEILQVTITFYDRGREVDWVIVEAGDSLGENLPEAPSRKGYLFLGWQSETGILLEESTVIQEDQAAYAAWEKITRGTITYWDGEEILYQITQDLGASIGGNLPPEPDREQFRFLGWNTREDGTGSKLYSSTVLREDLDVWAQWEEIQYVTLAFHDRFGSGRSITLEQGTKPGDQFPQNPARSGYTFKGWYTEENGAGQKVTKTTKIQEDTDVYAYWKAKSSTNANTGDAFQLAGWTVVLLLSGAALIVMFHHRKKKN